MSKKMSGKETYEKLKKQIESLSPFVKSWNSAKNLLNPKNIDDTLENAIGLANTKLALVIFVAAAVISTALSILALVEAVQLTNFTSDTITEVLNVQQQKVDLQETLPIAIFQIVMGLPLAIAVNIIGEWIGYRIVRISGGKGTLEKQLYLTSLIALSLGMVNVLILLVPIPCIQIIGWAGIAIGMLYLGVYVTCKAYSLIHKITFVHSFTIVLLISIMRFAAIILMMNLISAWLGMPAYFELP